MARFYEDEQEKKPCSFEGSDACDHCNKPCPNVQYSKDDGHYLEDSSYPDDY